MKIKEICQILESFFPKAHAEEFDNVGLLCGQAEREVSGILICHDALEEVMDEAIAKNCNFVISFHPLIFSPLKSLTGKNYVEKSVLKAIENKIAVYAIHTSFDNDYFGVNHRICNFLGLKNPQVLLPKNQNLEQLQVYVPSDFATPLTEALFTAGAGKIGFYDECAFKIIGVGSFRPLAGAQPFLGDVNTREIVSEHMISVVYESHQRSNILKAMRASHPYEEVAHQILRLENGNQFLGLGQFGEFLTPLDEADFLELVKNVFNLKVIKHSKFLNKKIKRVGVLGGSGASGLKAALNNKCDAYITGDLKYHDFFQAEDQLLLCDIGHFESEQFIVDQLFEKLSQKFSTFAVLKSGKDTNPVKYFF